VSTILKALSKHRLERDCGGDPEAVLTEDDPARALRGGFRSPSGVPRWAVALAAGSLVLAFLCVVGTFAIWVNGRLPRVEPTRRDNVGVKVPLSAPATPRPAPVAVETPEPRPVVRESVRLRTEPLLRPTPPAAATPTPSPVPAPAPNMVFVLPATLQTTSGGTSLEFQPSKPPAARNVQELLRLTGIILDPKTPTALINDEIVHVGDRVEGAKVLAIDSPNYVRVEYEGKPYSLELK